MLKDPKESVETTRFSTTRDAYLETIAVTGTNNYNINVIDTPGIFEVRTKEEGSRSNQELLGMAWNLLENSVTSLNAILLVFKYGRITQEDLEAVKVLKDFLNGTFPHNVVVIITGVERLTSSPQRLSSILNEMGAEALQTLSEFCEKRFLFMGATPADMVEWLSKEKIEKLHNGIISMRQYFIDQIVTLPACQLPEELLVLYNETLQGLRKNLHQLNNVQNNPEFDNKKINLQKMIADKLIQEQKEKADNRKKERVKPPNEDEKNEVKSLAEKKGREITLKISEERKNLGLPEREITATEEGSGTPKIITWKLEEDVKKFSTLSENIYQIQTAIQRNILIIGKTGVGKSTLLKFLDSPISISTNTTGYAQTENPEYKTRLLLDRNKNLAYNFNIIDTPGLFEVRETNEKKRATIEILDMIEKCLQKSMTSIHAVFIVYRYDQSCTREDLDAFEILKNFLTDLVPNMGMILTHAEQIDETKEQKTIDDITKSPQESVLRACQQRVYFTGILDEDDMDWYEKSVIEKLHNRARFRHNKLINDIIYTFKEAKSLPKEVIKLHMSALDNLKEKMHQQGTSSQSTTQSVNTSTTQPVNKSTTQPVNKSTTQPVNKSTTQPVNKTGFCVVS